MQNLPDVVATVALIKTPSAAAGDSGTDLRSEHGVTASVASSGPHQGALVTDLRSEHSVTASVATMVPHQGEWATSFPDIFRPPRTAVPWPSCFAPESCHNAGDADKVYTLVGTVTTNQRKRKLSTLANRQSNKAFYHLMKMILLIRISACIFNS